MALYRKNSKPDDPPVGSGVLQTQFQPRKKTVYEGYIPPVVPTFALKPVKVEDNFEFFQGPEKKEVYIDDKGIKHEYMIQEPVSDERLAKAFRSGYVPNKKNPSYGYTNSPEAIQSYFNEYGDVLPEFEEGPLLRAYKSWKEGDYAQLKGNRYGRKNYEGYLYGTPHYPEYQSTIPAREFDYSDKMLVLNRFYDPSFLDYIKKDSSNIDSLMRDMVTGDVYIDRDMESGVTGSTYPPIGYIRINPTTKKEEIPTTYAHEVMHNLWTPDGRKIKPSDSTHIMNLLSRYVQGKGKELNDATLKDSYYGAVDEIGARLGAAYLYPKTANTEITNRYYKK